MNSIIYQELVNKEYYLDYYCGGFSILAPLPFIKHREVNTGWEIVLETSDFTRELEQGESIHIDGENYQVVKVSHDTNGNIHYYTNKKIINEDLESMQKAKEELQKEKLREEEREEKKKATRDEHLRNISFEPIELEIKKKWYQFWK